MQSHKQRVTVYGLILNQNSEILLVKRSLHDSSPGIWEMPGGGLEQNEIPQEGVVREVQEETGLSVTTRHPISSLSGFSRRDPSIQVIRIAYLCTLTDISQKIKLSSEHMEYRFVEFNEISLYPLSDLLKETLRIIKKYPYLVSNI